VLTIVPSFVVLQLSLSSFIQCCDLFLPAGSAAGNSAGIFFTQVPVLGFFAPQGRHGTPIKAKFGREERTIGPLLPAKFCMPDFVCL